MLRKKNIGRREFLKKATSITAAAVSFPYIVPASALGKEGAVAPSNRITVGCIGLGWQGPSNMRRFLNESDAQVVAVCDIDANHLKKAQDRVNNKYGNTDCATYHNFSELIARDDIDAVSIALPDHWHAIPAIEAARAGKDIYGEKPLSHNLAEGRAMCDAVKRYNRIWQTGSWQRSQSHFRFACELVRNGCIGKVHRVEVGLYSGYADYNKNKNQQAPVDPPKELDYDRWLGPAPYAPYCPPRVHKTWRWNLDYGGGILMDWIGHHGDIAHWGLDMDNDAPIEVEGTGQFPRTGLWNAAKKFRINTKYANGIEMLISGGYPDVWAGTKWVGEDGWVWVNRSGRIKANPAGLLKSKFGPNDVNLFRSPGHVREFLDCIKTRSQTITPCETAHHSVIPGHLGHISMVLERKIRFNPDTEQIIDDPEASLMLKRPMRAPYHL